MSCYKLVIDTNIFYTFVELSSYPENLFDCVSLLCNIINCCEFKICRNDEIFKEFDKFKKKISKGKNRNFFNKWLEKMYYKQKFVLVQLATQIKPKIHKKDQKIHRKDIKFYQTAYNTTDKIIITQEKKLLALKEKVYQEFGINTLTIQDANDHIMRIHSIETLT